MPRSRLAVDRHLYVGGRSGARVGITVYELSDPAHLKNVGFVPTTNVPYHLFALPEKRLVVCQDSDSWSLFGIFTFQSFSGTGIHGREALFSLEDPTRPCRISERDRAGGGRRALKAERSMVPSV